MRVRAIALALLAAACTPATPQAPQPQRDPLAEGFPRPDRPVAAIVATQFSNEDARDDRREAEQLMDWAGIAPGMTVADIGAGEGYYSVRLAPRVGEKGRVLAQDINREALDRLAERVARDRLDNVSIALGLPADPRLPAASFDRIFLVHMYHEIEEPYVFLWRLRPALRPGGEIVVLDSDRPTGEHGTPPQLLFCEMAAMGLRLTGFAVQPGVGGYFARFVAEGPRPAPTAIKPCALAKR